MDQTITEISPAEVDFIARKDETQKPKKFHRRAILAAILIIPTAALLTHAVPVSADTAPDVEPLSTLDVPPKLDQSETEQLKLPESYSLSSFADTIKKQLLVMAGKFCINTILDRLHIDHGNKKIDWQEILEEIKTRPLKTLLTGGIVDPFLEEGVGRFLPYFLLGGKSKWLDNLLGVGSSLLFAYMHTEWKGWKTFKAIPLSYFVGGMFYWNRLTTKNFLHAWLAHAFNNSIIVTFCAGLFKVFPGEKSEKIAKRLILSEDRKD